jgi:predicted small lipoprotein YifL
MPVRTLIIVLLALAAVSGCGRRGSLQAPGAEPAVPGAPTTNASPLDPGSLVVEAPPEQPPPPARRRFFLDFLL